MFGGISGRKKSYLGIILFLLSILLLLKYSHFRTKLRHFSKTSDTAAHSPRPTLKKTLAWILHFNYKPNPDAVLTLLKHYSQHFLLIVIVTPTGRPEELKDEEEEGGEDDKVIWSPKCNNSENGSPADTMMRCYAKGLEILRHHPTFHKTDYVVLSNDDVILNMTKIQEFATEGRPTSHLDPAIDAPPMFSPPAGKYYKGWGYKKFWPKCQKLFAKVPGEYKKRFLERFGDVAFRGGVDVFFLPPESVGEFIFLSSVVSDCWIEMGIPNALSMLTVPIKSYVPPSEVFMYRWWGILITPAMFEKELSNHSIVSFHPFKLSYPEHRRAFGEFMKKYKFNVV